MPERTLDEQYSPSLLKFMSFKDGVNYPKGQRFTRNKLAAISNYTRTIDKMDATESLRYC